MISVWVDNSIGAVVKFCSKQSKRLIARPEQRLGFLKKQSKLPSQGGQRIAVNGQIDHRTPLNHTNPPHAVGLLCLCRERPRCCTPKSRDELPPPHSSSPQLIGRQPIARPVARERGHCRSSA